MCLWLFSFVRVIDVLQTYFVTYKSNNLLNQGFNCFCLCFFFQSFEQFGLSECSREWHHIFTSRDW